MSLCRREGAASFLGEALAGPAGTRAELTSLPRILKSWTLRPGVALLLLTIGGLYALGLASLRARGSRPFPHRKRNCFVAGWVVLVLALVSPVDRYSDYLLSVHMIQHLLLTMVAAPLLLLGAPVTLALQASSAGLRHRVLVPVLHSRIVKNFSHPIVGWSVFAIVLWASHFSPLYERALESQTIHGLEHVMYLMAALLFWWPVVGVDPAPSRPSHPARILYLFLSMPQTALLGLAIYESNRILYPHYMTASARLGVSALADQHLAGALMWTTGMFFVVPALVLVVLDWMEREEREAARADARLDAQMAARPAGGRAGPAPE